MAEPATMAPLPPYDLRRKPALLSLMVWIAAVAAGLTAATPAVGFFSSGTIDGDLGYSSLEIYKDQEDYWGGGPVAPVPRPHRRPRPTGSWYGFYTQDEYYLVGSLENLSNRPRTNLHVVFFASDCIRDRTHWSVTVVIDHLAAHQSLPFRQFISYSEPEFPCRFRFHVSETPLSAVTPPAVPDAAPAAEVPETAPPPNIPETDAPPPSAAPDDTAPVYKWIDENGVPHYTNRPVAPGDPRWQPAWEGNGR